MHYKMRSITTNTTPPSSPARFSKDLSSTHPKDGSSLWPLPYMEQSTPDTSHSTTPVCEQLEATSIC